MVSVPQAHQITMKINTSLGFEHDEVWVTNPYVTMNGRGDCDPLEEYGKTHAELLVIFQSEEYLEWLKATGEMDEEEDLPCCGCDKPVPEHEDYGNNSTVADTCCNTCWNAHLKAEGME